MNKRILVIDDDESIRKFFLHALEDAPYQVDTAASGEKGIELFNEFDYQLIFLDLNMPGMKDLDVLRKIRAVDLNLPIYIVTAFYKDFLDEINCAIDEGLKFEVTLKPITLEEIAFIANSVIEKQKIYEVENV